MAASCLFAHESSIKNRPVLLILFIQPLDARHRTDVDGLFLDNVLIRTTLVIDLCLAMAGKTKHFRIIIHAEPATDTGLLVNPQFFHLISLPLLITFIACSFPAFAKVSYALRQTSQLICQSVPFRSVAATMRLCKAKQFTGVKPTPNQNNKFHHM
jgi:hypothetical protein